jgi:hypothetical protein
MDSLHALNFNSTEQLTAQMKTETGFKVAKE